MGTYCITQGTLLNAPDWEGSPSGREHTYIYDGFILLSQITGKKSFSKNSNQGDVLWYTRFSLAFSYSLPELTLQELNYSFRHIVQLYGFF